jgi:hypothetical protein
VRHRSRRVRREQAVRDARRGVEDLDREAASEHRATRRDRATGEVEVHGPDDVDPGRRLEQAELRADPRVEVEQLVLLVAPVVAPVQVDDAPEAEAPAQVA